MRGSYIWAIALIFCVLLSCKGSDTTPEGYPKYDTQQEMAAAERDAAALLDKVLPKLDTGEELTSADIDLLKESARITEGIRASNPQAFNTYHRLGQIYLALGDRQKALERLRQYVEVAPKDDLGLAVSIADAHHLIAFALLQENQLPDAEKEINLALALYPDTINYLYTRARVYVEQRREDEAKKDLIKVIRLEPQHVDAKALMKFLNRPPTKKKSPAKVS